MYRVKSGIFGQTANFGQQPCLFHISNTGIKRRFYFFGHSKIKVRSCVLCVYAGTCISPGSTLFVMVKKSSRYKNTIF